MEKFDSRLESLVTHGIWNHLNIQVLKAHDGVAIIELPVMENLKQKQGVLHGGIIATILDMSMSLAVTTVLSEQEYSTTLDMHTTFLRPMFGETLQGRAEVLKRGRRVTVATANVFNEQGELIATSTGNFMNLEK